MHLLLWRHCEKALGHTSLVEMERFWGLAGRICYKSMHANQLTPVKHGGSNHVQTCTTAL